MDSQSSKLEFGTCLVVLVNFSSSTFTNDPSMGLFVLPEVIKKTMELLCKKNGLVNGTVNLVKLAKVPG